MNRILVVDDAPVNLQLLVDALEPAGHEVLTASDGETALELCARVRPDLILLDVMMSGMDGIAVCRRIKEMPSLADVPVIFITGLTDWEHLLRGFEAGGADYVVKPFRTQEILVRVAHHLRLSQTTRALAERNAELQRRMDELHEAHRLLLAETERRQQTETRLRSVGDQLSHLSAREAQRWGIAGFVGQSAAMAAILAEIGQLHQNAGTSVLITGESGTGKELVARAIHVGSARASRPFIAVNCVAISADLAESAFFGHVRGSFTGASTDHKGHFELAHGGTLFLDEIGDMPPGLQAKLLRVLEDGVVRPVGSGREIRTDVRVLAATNADLAGKMAAGQFREDLYYRLARFHIAVPPLRERREDIPLLVRHFIDMFAAEMGVRSPGVSPAAMELLVQQPLAGNVRELKNAIERALIRSGGELLQAEHLVLGTAAAARPAPAAPAGVPIAEVPLNLREAELHLMRRALLQADGNVSEAARLLGVHRSRLYRMPGD
jgi:DNA-binding NtrC family response regulator